MPITSGAAAARKDANKCSLWQDGQRIRAEAAPRHLLPLVHKNYVNPAHEAFRPQTLWRLSNAFTSALKDLKPVRQFQATARLEAFLESFNGGAQFQLSARTTGQELLPFFLSENARMFLFGGAPALAAEGEHL